MKNFAFKCHRKKQNVYAVNSLKFHKQFGTFSSAGGDETICFETRIRNSTRNFLLCTFRNTNGSNGCQGICGNFINHAMGVAAYLRYG